MLYQKWYLSPASFDHLGAAYQLPACVRFLLQFSSSPSEKKICTCIHLSNCHGIGYGVDYDIGKETGHLHHNKG